ncbi:MAG: hypothetical protein QM301_12090 [Bacteroidota bacterium]|nr:hypothetical protein [Bacteroidota bacterium]
MPQHININSTVDEPIRFFLQYPYIDRESLYSLYKDTNEPDRYYDSKKNVVMVYVETRIDEDVTEGAYEEYTFEDFLRSRFEEETQNSIQLITEIYRSKGDNENIWFYKRLLKAFVNHFERLKNYPDYPECELLPSSFLTVVNHAIKQYDQMYFFPLIAKVKGMIKVEGAVKTGYVIKNEYKPRIIGFNNELINASIIDPNTKPEQWYPFFRGEFPKEKINWIVNKPHGHLWYFIKKIKESEILVAFPKQQWKYLDCIFTFNDDAVPKKFYDNHYLNKKSKKVLNHAFHILKA